LKHFITVKPEQPQPKRNATKHVQTPSTQIFQLRETLASLTQVMEQIALDADNN